jgi:hypothetical protein
MLGIYTVKREAVSELTGRSMHRGNQQTMHSIFLDHFGATDASIMTCSESLSRRDKSKYRYNQSI